MATPRANEQPWVAVGALGGTISMTTDSHGESAVPTHGAATQAAWLTGGGVDGITVRSQDIALVGSPSMTVRVLLQALAFARQAVEDGASGVVLTHGTDTMAEAAYLLSVLWDKEAPLVFTGAMRPADVPGSDGPANLAGAVRVAADPSMRGLGVLVYFADFVHSATLCEKMDSTWVSAFDSPGWGPLARVDAESITRVLVPGFRFAPLPDPDPEVPIHIPIVTATLDGDGFALAALAQGVREREADGEGDGVCGRCEAVVLAGAGSGRVSAQAAQYAKALVAQGVTVVLVRKPSRGVTTRGSYAYPGSETDLIAGGLIPAGLLSPEKTRLLLHVLLQAGYRGEELAAELRRRCLA